MALSLSLSPPPSLSLYLGFYVQTGTRHCAASLIPVDWPVHMIDAVLTCALCVVEKRPCDLGWQ